MICQIYGQKQQLIESNSRHLFSV